MFLPFVTVALNDLVPLRRGPANQAASPYQYLASQLATAVAKTLNQQLSTSLTEDQIAVHIVSDRLPEGQELTFNAPPVWIRLVLSWAPSSHTDQALLRLDKELRRAIVDLRVFGLTNDSVTTVRLDILPINHGTTSLLHIS